MLQRGFDRPTKLVARAALELITLQLTSPGHWLYRPTGTSAGAAVPPALEHAGSEYTMLQLTSKLHQSLMQQHAMARKVPIPEPPAPSSIRLKWGEVKNAKKRD